MRYKVIGLMSGTSLDGLDMAYSFFELKNEKWEYSIQKAQTIKYSKKIIEELLRAEKTSSEDFVMIDKNFGTFMGKEVRKWIDKNSLEVDFIASGGQTIFHKPHLNLTTQIGDINALAAYSQKMVIGDFRRLDIALKGQGAPLVPIGDRLLFKDYPYCLNLGGFSNISFENKGKRIAYDICPVNMVLNHISQSLGKEYDKDGLIAKKGNIDNNLLERLNGLEYYKIKTKKSLGKEWVLENIYPLFEDSNISSYNLMATFVEHIAMQLSKNIRGDVLITGGGTFNTFLIDRLRTKIKYNIIIPHSDIINYKEALIFAFLGVLRYRNEINVLSSVTGARRDSCSGLVLA